MFWQPVIGKIQSLVHNAVDSILVTLTYVALLVAVAHYFGWLDRWIWFVVETESKKILNSAKVTMGSFQVDWSEILRGKITFHASNVVVHTPQRDEWMWESPLIARVGKASVECNAPITIFHEVVLGREIPIEAYTIQLSDLQVFVERRESVINVYLLNKTLILPPPPPRIKHQGLVVSDPTKGNGGTNATSSNHQERAGNALSPQSASTLTSLEANCDTKLPDVVDQEEARLLAEKNRSSARGSALPPQDAADHHNEQARRLVNEMVHAVQDLSRAATRGELPGAIKQQGLELVDRLRGFRRQDNVEEGLRVMQQFGKVAVESFQNAPKFIIPQPDNNVEKKKVYVRVGRVAIRDLRIFTKDSWIKASHDDNETNSANGIPLAGGTASLSQMGPTQSATPSTISSTGNVGGNVEGGTGSWNKPIFIERMVVRASELCPPMSMKDDQDLPAIYQSADRVAEVVWRRLLAEMAKSNTGKLFSTAMGEVLSAMLTTPNPPASASASGAAGSALAPSPLV
jgi:hypothetical protein